MRLKSSERGIGGKQSSDRREGNHSGPCQMGEGSGQLENQTTRQKTREGERGQRGDQKGKGGPERD